MLHLRTLGGLSVAANGAAGGGAPQQRKTLALLALLAASGPSGVSRDRLMAYLWPDSDTEHARALLKQACYVLRRDLREHDLFLGATELSLNPAVITSDLQILQDALQGGDRVAAVESYAGPFLDGFHLHGAREFEEWMERERARIAFRVESVLEALATESANCGDHRAATGWWGRLAELNPLSARAAIGVMAALDRLAEPVEAIRRGLSYAALVRTELGVEPGAEVSAFIRRLQERTARHDVMPPPPNGSRSLAAGIPGLAPVAEAGSPVSVAVAGLSGRSATWKVFLGLSLAASAGAVLFWRSRDRVHLDPELVAVAPFDALPPALEPWRDGLARMLSGQLEAAGVHVVPPSVVLREWRGRAAMDAVALGRQTGARLVVYGELLGAGRDSVRLSATLLDAEARRSLAVLDVRDAANRVDGLSDSLVLRILDQIGPTRPGAGTRPAASRDGRGIAASVLGPDGRRSVCDFLPQGAVVEGRLLNATPPPRQGGYDAFACPESDLRLSVPTPGPWVLRVRLPASPALGQLPLHHIQASPVTPEAGDRRLRIVVAQGARLGGGATLEGKPVAGVRFNLVDEAHRFVASYGRSGPDGRWVEFFGRSPPVLQRGVRYVAGPLCQFLGTMTVSRPPPRGFLFPTELSSLDCAMVTAPATRLTHGLTRLVVTPMPADIGGMGDDFVHEWGYGWGVQFPLAPGEAPSHDPDASHLFAGGLVIGIDPDRVLSGVNLTGEAECGLSCRDLGLDGQVRLSTLPGTGKQVTWQYSDAPSPKGVGLHITQVSMDGRPPADYVLFRFTITNGGTSPTTLHAGVLCDWDVGGNWDDDVGFTTMAGRLMYQASNYQAGPYLGTLLAGDAPVSGNYFFRKVAYPTVAEQLDALAGRRSRPTTDAPGDNRYIHAAGPFRLEHGQSAVLWVAVVAGETRNRLLTSASQAAADIERRRGQSSGE